MAPYHIRKYQESDRQRVLELFSQGMLEHTSTTFCYVLKLPRTLMFLLGVPLAVFLVSGSSVLALVAGLTLLTTLRLLANYVWSDYVNSSLCSDLSDITKSYLSGSGSCFWVAESEGQMVGTVAARSVKEPTLLKKQLQLLRLSVSLKHRGQGIAQALVRTVLQFGRDQGYSEVFLTTTMLQHSAVALYERMGFQRTDQSFHSMISRLLAISVLHFTYPLPSAQVPRAS